MWWRDFLHAFLFPATNQRLYCLFPTKRRFLPLSRKWPPPNSGQLISITFFAPSPRTLFTHLIHSSGVLKAGIGLDAKAVVRKLRAVLSYLMLWPLFEPLFISGRLQVQASTKTLIFIIVVVIIITIIIRPLAVQLYSKNCVADLNQYILS